MTSSPISVIRLREGPAQDEHVSHAHTYLLGVIMPTPSRIGRCHRGSYAPGRVSERLIAKPTLHVIAARHPTWRVLPRMALDQAHCFIRGDARFDDDADEIALAARS